MELTTHTHKGVDKTARYGWVTKDEPGEQRMLHKDMLLIDRAYQRDLLPEKVKAITASFSWIAFGALTVAERGGQYWVIEGQHRAAAAKRRSDIAYLPCVVFKTEDIKQEAQAFIRANTERKPVKAIEKQKALVVAGDQIAGYVQSVLDQLGIEMAPNSRLPNTIKCVSWCIRRASEDKEAFRTVLSLGAELCAKDDMPVMEKVVDGLWFINSKCEGGLADKRLVRRLQEKGGRVLLEAANRAGAYYAHGGGKIWAQGMLAEVNKGLQRKFTMDGVDT